MSKSLATIGLCELREKEFPPRNDVLGGVIGEYSKTIISAPAKLGKTRFSSGLAIGLALGKSVMGFEIKTPRKVLYIQAEVSDRSLKERMDLMLNGWKFERDLLNSNFVYCNERSIKFTQAHSVSRVTDLLALKRPDILFIDPLYKFNTGDESSTRDMTAFFDPLDQFIQDFKLSIILIHHHGKAREGAPVTPAHLNRGSSTIADWADNLFTLQVQPAKRVKLDFTLREFREPKPRLYKKNEETLWFEPCEFEEPSKAGAPQKVTLQDVVTIISTTPLEKKEIIQEIIISKGVTKRTASKVVNDAIEADLIGFNGEGKIHARHGK